MPLPLAARTARRTRRCRTMIRPPDALQHLTCRWRDPADHVGVEQPTPSGLGGRPPGSSFTANGMPRPNAAIWSTSSVVGSATWRRMRNATSSSPSGRAASVAPGARSGLALRDVSVDRCGQPVGEHDAHPFVVGRTGDMMSRSWRRRRRGCRRWSGGGHSWPTPGGPVRRPDEQPLVNSRRTTRTLRRRARGRSPLGGGRGGRRATTGDAGTRRRAPRRPARTAMRPRTALMFPGDAIPQLPRVS